MKWYAYCMTCNLNLACMKPHKLTSLHGSMVEQFAEHHQKTYLEHHILVGYLYESSDIESELTFNKKGIIPHG